MGLPLRTTFADFFMSELENKFLPVPDEYNPLYYRRYIDDILAISKDKCSMENFKNKLTITSVLDFTHEEA